MAVFQAAALAAVAATWVETCGAALWIVLRPSLKQDFMHDGVGTHLHVSVNNA